MFPARSLTPPAGIVGMIVPPPVAVIATVYVVEFTDVIDCTARPVAVPPTLTSAATKALTGSLKATGKLIGGVFVGSACPAAWLIVTFGLTVSTVKVFAELKPVLPAVSV